MFHYIVTLESHSVIGSLKLWHIVNFSLQVSGVAFDSYWSSPTSDDTEENVVYRFGSVGQVIALPSVCPLGHRVISLFHQIILQCKI